MYEQTLIGNPDERWHVIDEANPTGYAQTYETTDTGSDSDVVEASFVLGDRVHGLYRARSRVLGGAWCE